MSVCYFVNSEEAATVTNDEEEETAVVVEQVTVDNTQQLLTEFWVKVTDDICKVTAEDFKTQALPLARIKKIMKLDEDVKMISAEAPILFAKAAEIFIHELTLRAWIHTEENKRRTLQRNDIAMAISKSDQFDFLIDIVPRHEVKLVVNKPREELPKVNPTTDQYYLQLAEQHQAALQTTTTQPQFVLQPCPPIVQESTAGTSSAAATSSNTATAVPAQQPIALVHQIVTNNGDMQQVPLQLTQAQLNVIRMQIQNNPNQPIIIHTQPAPAAQAQQTPQIIQVSSQAQPQQHVYLAQVATTQEDS